jgi:hypothetical protein
VPGAPCGPAGPGTVTTAGGEGATAGGRLHALNASVDSTAATAIEYLMMILLFVEQELRAELRAVVQKSAAPAMMAMVSSVALNFRKVQSN